MNLQPYSDREYWVSQPLVFERFSQDFNKWLSSCSKGLSGLAHQLIFLKLLLDLHTLLKKGPLCVYLVMTRMARATDLRQHSTVERPHSYYLKAATQLLQNTWILLIFCTALRPLFLADALHT